MFIGLGQQRPEAGWVSLADGDALKQMAEANLPYGQGYGIEERLERSNILLARNTYVMLMLMDAMHEEGSG